MDTVPGTKPGFPRPKTGLAVVSLALEAKTGDRSFPNHANQGISLETSPSETSDLLAAWLSASGCFLCSTQHPNPSLTEGSPPEQTLQGRHLSHWLLHVFHLPHAPLSQDVAGHVFVMVMIRVVFSNCQIRNWNT